ncbi:MAG: elongation factor G [Myxococcales bacterium]|jgi:elongation factor G
MNVQDPRRIRNVGLFGHQGSGKTSLAEALLWSAQATPKFGSVADETSNLDTEPEEIKRKGSIALHVGWCGWKDHKVNVVDTPGDPNFSMDMRAALAAVDLAAVVVSAVDGVQVQTDRAFTYATEAKLPRLVFINKMDRERADFDATLADVKESLSAQAIPVQIPLGKEESFAGVIDLLSMKALRFKTDASGGFAEEEVPAELEDAAKKAREALVDAVAATDDVLTEKYLEVGDLTPEELQTGLTKGILAGAVIPVFCGSSTKNIGAAALLDFLVASCPSPADRPAIVGKDPRTQEDVERPCDPAAPLAAQVFRTVVDQFVGKLTIFRVWSGTMGGDGQIQNSTKNATERYSQLLSLQGRKHEPAQQAIAGDIAVIAKFKETGTGDTLCDPKNPVVLPDLPKVKPVITYALKPKTKQDEDRIAAALHRLCDEDPTLEIGRDVEAGETLISGVGQTHIEVTVERLKRKYSVDVELLPPKIPYRETIKGSALNVEGKHKKQSGGRGQFGVCYINLEPNRGNGYEFVDKIVGGAIPRNFIPSVDKGIRGQLAKGVYAGYPIVDVKVELIDGKYHDVDSSDFSFQMAGSKGFKQAFMAAKPTLLEPIMNIEVTIPEESTGDVIGDINQRRGRVLGVDTKGKNQIIKAQAPMSELLTYAPDLRSITSGRGSFTMEYSHYDEVPANLAEKVVAAAKSRLKEEEEE